MNEDEMISICIKDLPDHICHEFDLLVLKLLECILPNLDQINNNLILNALARVNCLILAEMISDINELKKCSRLYSSCFEENMEKLIYFHSKKCTE